jgi:hypothetical protein
MAEPLPLAQFIFDKIVPDWVNGKQLVKITTRTPSPDAVYKVNDLVRVMDKRRADMDESDIAQINKYSILKKLDGAAKVFKVMSARFDGGGNRVQVLELLEES